MESVVFIITHDPRERFELVSSIFAQALTALSFDYECEIFAMDRGANIVKKGYVDGLKAVTFDPLADLIRYYKELGGKLYACYPSTTACDIGTENCIDAVDGYVNATKLMESSSKARMVLTY